MGIWKVCQIPEGYLLFIIAISLQIWIVILFDLKFKSDYILYLKIGTYIVQIAM